MAKQTREITCEGCGACCMGQNLLPWSGRAYGISDHLPRVPAKLWAELEAIENGPLAGDDDCPCVWLDRATGKCRHYEYRPATCRDCIQPGDENCLRIRREVGL
jgi:Fe-S-cluster containining protein